MYRLEYTSRYLLSIVLSCHRYNKDRYNVLIYQIYLYKVINNYKFYFVNNFD